MFDFDTESMARALRVSSEKMRDKVFESLRDYMTTMKRELGEPPPADDVKEVLLANLQRRLGIDLEPGELDRRERRMVGALNRRFQSPEWLHQKGGRKRAGIRIKEGLLVAEAEYKAPGGLIRVTARLKEGEIDDITISGDFTFEPAAFLTRLENGLRGSSLDEQKLEKLIGEFYRSGDVQAPGLEPEHLARAIARLGTTAEG